MYNCYALSYPGAPESAAVRANGMHYVYLVMSGWVITGAFISLALGKKKASPSVVVSPESQPQG